MSYSISPLIKEARFFKGVNFITPKILGYGISGKYVYEVSSGNNPFQPMQKLWGLTVKDKLTGETNRELSTCFDNYENLEIAINNLGE